MLSVYLMYVCVRVCLKCRWGVAGFALGVAGDVAGMCAASCTGGVLVLWAGVWDWGAT